MEGNGTLDDLYLAWLYRQVANPKLKNPSRTYWHLLRALYKKEFVWIIPNDDNRVEDGRALRQEFLTELDDELVPEDWRDWTELGCSFLEMLVALSHRLSFQDDGPVDEWFWKLIEHLDLERCNDRVFDHIHESQVEDACDQVIWRTYKPNGVGGLFPLRHPPQDQREVEIWYQVSAYFLENDLI